MDTSQSNPIREVDSTQLKEGQIFGASDLGSSRLRRRPKIALRRGRLIRVWGMPITLVFLNTTHLTRTDEHQHAWLAGLGPERLRDRIHLLYP